MAITEHNAKGPPPCASGPLVAAFLSDLSLPAFIWTNVCPDGAARISINRASHPPSRVGASENLIDGPASCRKSAETVTRYRMPDAGAATAALATVATSPTVFPSFGNVSADLLIEAFAEYNAKLAEFLAIPIDEITSENEDAFVAATYLPAQNRLLHEPPPVTSNRGVAEAIRYALETNSLLDGGAVAVLESALAYLDGS